MSIPIGEAIQLVQSIYSAGVQSKDSRLTTRHIYSALLNARSELVRQQSNKNQKINRWVYQTLPCIELEKVKLTDIAGIPDNNGCVILRSKSKLPKLISDMSKTLIRSITDLEGTEIFTNTEFETNKYNKGNKYTSNNYKSYIRDGRLFITVLKERKAITLEGLFEDPIEVYRFPNICEPCTECQCKANEDIDFPIDRSLLRTLGLLANKELIAMMKQMTEDTTNNAKDDTQVNRMIHASNPDDGQN